MSTIFVSYRHNDSSGYTGRLYDRLVKHFGKERIFRDIDKIQYGDDFVEALDDAVGSCKALITIIGPSWLGTKNNSGRRRLDNQQDFVRIEIESALIRKIPIFPVLVGGADMPEADDLPENISKLARRQALEISETRFDYDVEQLLKALEAKVGQPKKITKVPLNKPRPEEIEKKPDNQNFSKGLKAAHLSTYAINKLTYLDKYSQRLFLDLYRQRKKSKRIAYLFFLTLGLHNLYLKKILRQFLFLAVPAVIFFFTIHRVFDEEVSLVLVLIWPLIDLFRLPSMVRRYNESIALSLLDKSP